MNIIEKKVKDLKPYEKNPRLNDDAVKYVAESIKNFGFKVPLVIDKDNNIVCGHTRWKACKKLKIDTVPCVVADDLTEEQIRAYRLADNRVAEKAEWDLALLDTELAEIETIDMTLLGFDDKEDETPQEVVEDDFDEEPPAEPIAKYGDLYQLGRHKLLCGDSTKIEDVQCLMGGHKADMVFTDPPYGMKKENEGVANDNLNFDDLLAFNKEWIPLSFSALKENGSWYCWGIDEPLMDIYAEILKPLQKQKLITFRNLLTWDKGNGQGQLSEKETMYPIADEKCLFISLGRTVLHINSWQKKFDERFRPLLKYLQEQQKICGWSTEELKTIAGCEGKVANHWTTTDQWRVPPKDVYDRWVDWAKKHGKKAFLKPHKLLVEEQQRIKKEYEKERTYFDNTHDNQNNVWHFARAGKTERVGHSTPKPIALCSRAIKSSSREEEIVLDLFGGGGSTLIACEQLNRKCFMMELEPKWVDVILQRYINFKGSNADVFLLKDGKRIPYSEVV